MIIVHKLIQLLVQKLDETFDWFRLLNFDVFYVN